MKNLEITLVCVVTILTVITAAKWGSMNWGAKICLFLAILTAIIVVINGYNKNKEDELKKQADVIKDQREDIRNRREDLSREIELKFGDISDLQGATIPMLTFGDGGVKMHLVDGVLNLQPIGKVIKLYVKQNKLHVTMTIRDRDGMSVAAVLDNTWTLYNHEYEYNFDNTAFELVEKGDREVYFQVELKNGMAYVSGVLFNKNGDGLAFVPKSDGMDMVVIPANSGYPFDNSTIKRIFKYPREKYESVRESEN